MYKLLKKIINCPSVSGREGAVSELLRDEILPFADECYNDSLGNLIALKKGSGKNKKKIMLCAHMDEIGFMVTFIEDNGYIRCAPIGGINYSAAAYSIVVFENGTKGVLVPEVGVKPQDYTFDKFYVDIGATNKKDAESRVKIGDFLVTEPSFTRLCKNRVAGRPFDDRVGCAVLIKIAREIASVGCKDDIYYVFSVQEEVGARGAKPAAFAIAPDYALVFDVTGTGDAIGAKPMAVKVGDGAAIKIKDSSVICNTEIVEKLLTVAKEKKIKHQSEILIRGGTDTSSIQMTGLGVKVGAISIPSKYIHSNVEIIDITDAQACVSLALGFIESI